MEKFIDLIFRQDVKKIEALIKSGEIKADEDVNRGQRALALASACNYIDVMKCLIKNGADVNESNADDLGYTPLEEAAREGKVEAVKLLIKENAQLDKGNTINTNAFIGACICAQTDVIEILLDSGANINHADINGQTALHYLCRYAKQWGGGVITETINGITREKENSRYKKHTITFEKLLEKGADVNLETKYGYSALHLAS